jgi:hypothetical protein
VETLKLRHFLSASIRAMSFCYGTNGVGAEQQAKRRFIETGDIDDGGRGLNWITRLGSVIVALEAGYCADGGVVLGATVADRCRRTREVGAETAWLNDRDLDAKRADLFREYFGESFDAPFGGGIGRAATAPTRPPTEENWMM